MTLKLPPNVNAPPLHVNHADLVKVDESSWRRQCPVCKEGLLLVSRNPHTLKLQAIDRCILCGQLVNYDDVKQMRLKDFAPHPHSHI